MQFETKLYGLIPWIKQFCSESSVMRPIAEQYSQLHVKQG